ncbi:MAG: efflux RND transporter permease subunit [Planctomycetes bacterium]|nr:efflux RND transporter permease subunit [Planctomycetota bacterium]
MEINHSGLRRVANVLVNTDGCDITFVAGGLSKALKRVSVPQGMQLRLKAEFARMGKTFGRLAGGLVPAALLVYPLPVTSFRWWAGPLVIKATVPFGFIGLFLTGCHGQARVNVREAAELVRVKTIRPRCDADLAVAFEQPAFFAPVFSWSRGEWFGSFLSWWILTTGLLRGSGRLPGRRGSLSSQGAMKS